MTGGFALHCDDGQFAALLADADHDSRSAAEAVAQTIATFPNDARLHFLLGSLLIDLRRFIEAHAALVRAVTLAPDFHIARFQLGFFELTSGEAEAARASWQPLLRTLPREHFLCRFVVGLEALIADRFDLCINALTEGMAIND